MESVRTQHEVRRRTNADLAQAESRLAKGKADLLSAEIDSNVAASAYVRITGNDPGVLAKPEKLIVYQLAPQKLKESP